MSNNNSSNFTNQNSAKGIRNDLDNQRKAITPTTIKKGENDMSNQQPVAVENKTNPDVIRELLSFISNSNLAAQPVQSFQPEQPSYDELLKCVEKNNSLIEKMMSITQGPTFDEEVKKVKDAAMCLMNFIKTINGTSRLGVKYKSINGVKVSIDDANKLVSALLEITNANSYQELIYAYDNSINKNVLMKIKDDANVIEFINTLDELDKAVKIA